MTSHGRKRELALLAFVVAVAMTVASCVIELASDQDMPTGVALEKSTALYWVNQAGGNVQRQSLVNGTITTLASGQSGPTGIAVFEGYVYWTNQTGGTVMKVATAGGAATVLASGESMPTGIAVDATGAYWTNLGNNKIRTVALNGGSVRTIASKQGAPTSIALDDTYAYWTSFNDGKIRRARKDGADSAHTLVTGQAGVYGIAVDGGTLYWTTQTGGTVMKSPVDGSAPTTLASGQGGPTGIAVDGGLVYWTNRTASTVMMAPAVGGPPLTLATAQGGPTGLVAADLNAYWTNQTDGTVKRWLSDAPRSWQNLWPSGGWTNALAVLPSDPHTIYVGGRGGLFKSTGITEDANGNLDAHWESLTNGLTGWRVRDIAIDPTNPSTVFVSMLDAGLFKSTDGGASFRLVTTTDDGGPSTIRARNVTISPANHDVVFVGGVRPARSSDGGETWTPFTILNGSGFPLQIELFAFDPADPAIVYAVSGDPGLSSERVFKSTDGGITFTVKSVGIAPGSGGGEQIFAIDPATSPPTLYVRVVSSAGPVVIYKSTDRAESWSVFASVTGGPIQPPYFLCCGPNLVHVDPSTSPSTIYMAATPIVRSLDGGATWHPLPEPWQPETWLDNGILSPYHGDVRRIVTLPAAMPEQQTILQVNDGGIYRSVDGGATWKDLNKGYGAALTSDFAIDPKDGRHIWTQLWDYVGYSTHNAGQRWSPNFKHGELASLKYDPIDPNILYVTDSGQGFGVVDDQGSDDLAKPLVHRNVGLEQTYGAPELAFDLAHPGSVYTYYSDLRTGGGVYKTADRGVSGWQKLTQLGVNLIPGGPDPGFDTLTYATVAQTSPITIYLTILYRGIYVSTDDGATWAKTSFPDGKYVSRIYVHPDDPDTVFALTTQELYVSYDAGATWLRKSDAEGLDFYPHPTGSSGFDVIGDVIADPIVPSTIYLATYNGVFRSLDDGATWAPFDEGLSRSKGANKLQFDPSDWHVLYVGIVGGGVHRRSVW